MWIFNSQCIDKLSAKKHILCNTYKGLFINYVMRQRGGEGVAQHVIFHYKGGKGGFGKKKCITKGDQAKSYLKL